MRATYASCRAEDFKLWIVTNTNLRMFDPELAKPFFIQNM